MYCSNCGIKNDGNNFCTNCGKKLENINSGMIEKKENNGLKTASIVLGILSLVGTFMIIFSPFSLTLSLIGLILGICATKKGKNVVGILLNAIGLVLSIIMILGIVFLIRFAYNNYTGYTKNNYYDNNSNKYFDGFYDNDFGFGNIEEYFNEFFNNDGYNNKQYDNDYYENFKDIISIY